MQSRTTTSAWQRWLQHPQRLPLRRAVFQVHMVSGLVLGLYIFFISVTGSVLVYRNELFELATPEPVYSTSAGPQLSDAALRAAIREAYPLSSIQRTLRPTDPDRAVEVWLNGPDGIRRRLFDPRTGADLGRASTAGIRAVSTLMALHDNFLAGPAGRKVNGAGALAVLMLVLTGLVIWWPGRRRWRRSLRLHRGVKGRRFIWDLHSMVGIWTAAAIMVFATSGAYLCFPETFHALAERLQPSTPDNAGSRLIDSVLYWLAFLHFGRIDGIGLPCSGPGLCDQGTKAVWALFGLAPALMFVTGAGMWWNRVLRRRWRHWFGRDDDGTPAAGD